MELAKQTQSGLQKSGQCLSTRLQSFLAGTDPNILQVLQMETGKECIIAYYHDTMQFCNKKPEYWSNTFPRHFMEWGLMLGLRSAPDKALELDIKSTLEDSFPHLNEETVKLAIKMNLEGHFGEVVQCYNSINRPYLTEILRKFDLKLKSDHKRLLELKLKFQDGNERELSKSEKNEKMRILTLSVFDEYKKNSDMAIISHPIYDYLVKIGNITRENVTPEKRNELMVEAESIVKSIISRPDKPLSEIFASLSSDLGRLSVKNKAKELAVKFYFDSITEITINEKRKD